MCRAVAGKRRAFEKWLQRIDRVTYDRYRAQRVAVKLAVPLYKGKGENMNVATLEVLVC